MKTLFLILMTSVAILFIRWNSFNEVAPSHKADVAHNKSAKTNIDNNGHLGIITECSYDNNMQAKIVIVNYKKKDIHEVPMGTNKNKRTKVKLQNNYPSL